MSMCLEWNSFSVNAGFAQLRFSFERQKIVLTSWKKNLSKDKKRNHGHLFFSECQSIRLERRGPRTMAILRFRVTDNLIASIQNFWPKSTKLTKNRKTWFTPKIAARKSFISFQLLPGKDWAEAEAEAETLIDWVTRIGNLKFETILKKGALKIRRKCGRPMINDGLLLQQVANFSLMTVQPEENCDSYLLIELSRQVATGQQLQHRHGMIN